MFCQRHDVFSPDLEYDVEGSVFTVGMAQLVESRAYKLKCMNKMKMSGINNILSVLPSLCLSVFPSELHCGNQ